MPSKSAAQKRLMDAAAHNPDFAKKVGIPVSVAKEFSKASKGQKFGSGTRPGQQEINKPKTNHGGSALFAKGGTMKESKAMELRHVAAMKKAGVPKKIVAEEQREAAAMKKGGKVKRMFAGGPTSTPAGPMAMGGPNPLTGGVPAPTGGAAASRPPTGGFFGPGPSAPGAFNSAGAQAAQAAMAAQQRGPSPMGAQRQAAMANMAAMAAQKRGPSPMGMQQRLERASTAGGMSPAQRLQAIGARGERDMKSGGKTKESRYASGGSVRGDGCAQRGKTKGKMV